MQIMDSTGVNDLEASLQRRLNEHKPNDADSTGEQTDSKSTSRRYDIAGRTDCHSAGQRRIRHIDHRGFALVEIGTQEVSADGGTTQREHRIDHRLRHLLEGNDGCGETGPEKPENHGTKHCEPV